VVSHGLSYNATIAERVDLTDTLSIFRIAPDRLPQHRPWFTAGQYCLLGLNDPQHLPQSTVCRPMSIASAPEAEGPIEFYIRRVETPRTPNPFTHLLWTRKRGARLYLRTVAAGVFTIEDTIGVSDTRLRVLVAAGTGIAPFISMIRSEIARNRAVDLSKWVLLHGASYPSELGYRQELLRYSETNHLKYWASISRPAAQMAWCGDTGRVESFFGPERLAELERRLGLPAQGFKPDKVVVFVCGLRGTLEGTLVPLIARGFVPNVKVIRDALGVAAPAQGSLFFENYDTEPVMLLNDASLLRAVRLP